MSNNSNSTVDAILHIASAYSKEIMNDSIYPAHILKALLHKDIGLISFIEQDLDKDYYYLRDWADMQMLSYPKITRSVSDPELSSDALATLSEADDFRLKLEDDEITPIHILLALVTPGVGFTFEQLKTFPLTADEILSQINRTVSTPQPGKPASSGGSSSKKNSAISKYTINKNEKLQDENQWEIVGFEKELQIMFETFGRKNKSNVLLVGESGVGKTALINAFVQRINKGEVPVFLEDITVYEVDLTAISSEANYKGEVEDRMKKLLSELAENSRNILVIENIDKVFDKNSILSGVSNLLKKELGQNQIKLIGSCSVEGFTKSIETDKEFVGKVEKLAIDEPTIAMTARIIKGIKPHFENHHQITLSDEVTMEAIRLAKRFMAERSLPDTALDLIDKTLAHIQTMNNSSEKEIDLLKSKLDTIKKRKNEGENIEYDLTWLHHEVLHRLSFLLTSCLDESIDFSSLKTDEEKISYLEEIIGKLGELSHSKKSEVDVPDLSLIIAQQTGIPIGKVQSKERDKLINAENIIKERVVGQDHAIKTVLEAIYESRSGLNKKGQPIASVFFLGPTGTGKTELTKSLAEFLFQDESAIIRFDMSEFMESHSVATMTGAPAGYVGYEEGGLLVNKIRQKPYSIVLFDEIEKAHPDVFNIFLQLMDEGRIHDKLNRVGDFSNALIVFTSNVGSDYVFKSFEAGVVPSSNELKQIMIERKFKPEFLGRLTEIIPFSPITKEIVLMIFDIHLKNLQKTMDEMKIKLTIPADVREHLALSEFSPELGARPILGIIRNQLRRPLSKKIISGEIKKGDHVELLLNNGELVWKS